jgi:hypothetical protein
LVFFSRVESEFLNKGAKNTSDEEVKVVAMYLGLPVPQL